MLVQIAVCKCHPKFTSGRVELAVLAEEVVYEQVDGEGGLAVSDPTYMEVGEGGGGNTIELKENEAYGAAIAVRCDTNDQAYVGGDAGVSSTL